MNKCYGIILAAGEGKRMKSKLPKVLHKVCGEPMIDYVISALKDAGVEDYIVVVGHGKDEVINHLGDGAKIAYQENQLGTGHAVMCCRDYLKDKTGSVIVLTGDAPLINKDTISNVLKFNCDNKYAATVLTADAENPEGFGRIVRDSRGDIEKIVEHKDASPSEKEIKEINSGTYCFKIDELLDSLDKIDNKNSQGEYYLTDVIEILKKNGKNVGAFKADFNEFMGVNTRIQLYEANEVMRMKILERHMLDGVTVIDMKSTYIDRNVKIGQDTIIYPGTIIEGNSTIGSECVIGPNSRICDSTIGDETHVQSSVVLNSAIGNNTTVGPFAYVRPDSSIGNHVRIGDFVEIKKSTIGDKTKVSHLTYIGDAKVGESCNFGCGTVIVNYDGTKKYTTVIGNHAFIGCNSNLVSPVKIGDNSYIAAGSTITDDVPEDSLAIARERQVNKEGWVKKKGIWKK